MNQKLASLVGVAAVLLVAGCGGDSSAGADDDTVTIAFPVPLTSGNSTFAQQMVNSAELAVKQINADGGAGGKKLDLRVYDDKLSADESAKIAQRALTVDGAEVVMGGYTSIEGLAIREVAERRDVAYIATSTVSPQLTDDDPKTTFRSAYRHDDYVPAMVEVIETLGIKDSVVVHDDAATGGTLFEPLGEALEEAGVTAGDPVGFAFGATDLSSAARAVVSQKPSSVIILGSSGADAGLMVKTLVEQGLKVPTVGISSLGSADAQKIAGAALAELPGVYIMSNFQPSKLQFQEFITAYAEEYGGNPDELAGSMSEAAPETFDAFTLLKGALDATKGETSGAAISEALQSLEPFEGAAGKAGSMVSFSDSHDAFHETLGAFKLENGSLVEFQ